MLDVKMHGDSDVNESGWRSLVKRLAALGVLMALVAVGMAVTVGVAGGSRSSGTLVSPPNDARPAWSPDGSQVAFLESGDFYAKQAPFLGLVAADGSGQLLKVTPAAVGGSPGPPIIFFSPDSSMVAYPVSQVINYVFTPWVAVVARDGSGQRLLVKNASPVGWIGNEIVFSDTSGQLGLVRPDGSGVTRFPTGVRGTPSPDGQHFASTQTTGTTSRVVVVDATGRVVLDKPGAFPIWSPDSQRIAYQNLGDRIITTNLSGEARSYPIGVAGAQLDQWSPNGKALLYETGDVFALNLVTGTSRRVASRAENGVYSPDGRSIAYASDGVCSGYGGRQGIYIARADGSAARRLTNDCHIIGTAGNDTLTGSPYYDIIEGLAGNDKLVANDGYFQGDTLIGGSGNDTLIGGPYRDTLIGGPGDDRLYGGGFGDILIGGPGHDYISGGRGNDVIYAADGERDWILCGTNRPNGNYPKEHDVVYADQFDVVAKDCEVVHRIHMKPNTG
jgi:Tol biopolymer transport system component